jgi:hypothetical protein
MSRQISSVVALALALLGLYVSPARAGTVTMGACMAATALSADWIHTSSPTFNSGLAEVDNCGSGGRFQIVYDKVSGATGKNDNGQWTTALPLDMSLVSASVPADQITQDGILINPATANSRGSSGFNVRFLWNGGSYVLRDGGSCCDGMDYSPAWSTGISGRYFIIQVACTLSSCDLPSSGNQEIVDVKNVQLVASDNVAPVIGFPAGTADTPNLADQQGWVRGDGWTFTADASNSQASGVCQMSLSVDGVAHQVSQVPDTTRWLQCPASVPMSEAVNTTGFANGSIPIEVAASDAASPANSVSRSLRLNVDNDPVSVTLEGQHDTPVDSASDASSVVSGQATAGPSGVASTLCSIDDGPFSARGAAAAQVTVSGLGAHRVRCYAQNRALNVQGQPARSPTQEFDLLIRRKTTEVTAFRRIVGLRCRRVRIRVKEPGHWRPSRRLVQRCGGRSVRRRVSVVVVRHGRLVRIRRTVRIVVPPRAIQSRVLRIAHGRSVTVSGYLGLTDGTPLADQAIEVLAAPRDGFSQLDPVAEVRTGPLGTWSATLGPGPSRSIEASYPGSAYDEPIRSGQLVLNVPARVRLLRVTRHVPWGGTVRISGRLFGGYLPPTGTIVRLRYGYGRARTTFGVLHVGGNGAFSTTFTFGPGPSNLRARYWFSANVISQADYPFDAASSPRRYVTVGGGSITPPRRSWR